jgi:metacaspase-1
MTKRYSLHIGLNQVDPAHYNGWSGPLRACEADANDMAAIARALGYAETNTRDATSRRLIGELVRLSRTLQAGDLLLITCSSHGGQVPDLNGDEGDKLDETWCLYDRQLIDDELYRLIGLFQPGVRIFALSDSCHSGSVLRDQVAAQRPTAIDVARGTADLPGLDPEDAETLRAGVARLAPLEVTRAAFEQHRDVYQAVQAAAAGGMEAAPKAEAILISGCQDNQVSLDGARNGLFTANLKRVWDSGRFTGSHQAFHREIAARMPASQTPNLFRPGMVSAAFLAATPFKA